MKITPLDIRHREFKRGLRGYVDTDVDEFLDDVADEFERLFKENIDLTERLEALNEKVAGYKRIEDALQKTLVSAQASAEEVKQTASKSAQLMLHEAELKARQLMNESYSERQAVEQVTAKLRSAEQDFRFKFRQMLQSYLKQAEESLVPATEGDATSETQVELARQADAIREAIAREDVQVAGLDDEVEPVWPPPEPAQPREDSTQTPVTAPMSEAASEPDGAAPADQVSHAEQAFQPAAEVSQLTAEASPPAAEVSQLTAEASPRADQGEAAAEASGEPAKTDRILFGERDDLLADVDSEVTENEFKW